MRRGKAGGRYRGSGSRVPGSRVRGGRHDASGARHRRHEPSAAPHRGGANASTARIHLVDRGLLALDWNPIRVDSGALGSEPSRRGNLASAALREGRRLVHLRAGDVVDRSAPDAAERERYVRYDRQRVSLMPLFAARSRAALSFLGVLSFSLALTLRADAAGPLLHERIPDDPRDDLANKVVLDG